ncbi:MAG: hypothetical protein K1Y36_19495 [Blastocatellia bacterium]|nr:hypothetical protein [Blastocatellia bacterium]
MKCDWLDFALDFSAKSWILFQDELRQHPDGMQRNLERLFGILDHVQQNLDDTFQVLDNLFNF